MPTTTLPTLSFEIITCIADHLTSKELSILSQCNKTLYQLQWMDSLWKKFCRIEFGIDYNHPNQTYRELFISCYKTKRNHHKRLPCNHISRSDHLLTPLPPPVVMEKRNHHCQRCLKEGIENLFICISPNCHQTICDRHARQHSRFSSSSHHHALFYKMNTSELFCQLCVDWIGGIESNPAELHIASEITNKWFHHLYYKQEEKVEDGEQSSSCILKFNQIRQIERTLRWKDTPHYVINNYFCFISSNWMTEWEMFIEGWKTTPPYHVTIDQTQLLLSLAVVSAVAVGPTNNPFYLNSNDNNSSNSVMMISSSTWDYLASHYNVKGQKITQDDLKPIEQYTLLMKKN